ncbi:hypothetical protein LCGC14_1357600 [marine sediment metagenome]|uniref:Uncharacterized protein n=1 Tax=marine sediment metagenome TaxID=412755 RepID=A0A0F9MPF2_9ZZZZ
MTEEKTESKDLDSIRGVQKKTLEAMERLKKRLEDTDKQILVLKTEIPGLVERQETLEKVIHMLMEGAPEKLQEFLSKASGDSQNDSDEAEALEGGSPEPEKEADEEDSPSAEVVG